MSGAGPSPPGEPDRSDTPPPAAPRRLRSPAERRARRKDTPAQPPAEEPTASPAADPAPSAEATTPAEDISAAAPPPDEPNVVDAGISDAHVERDRLDELIADHDADSPAPDLPAPANPPPATPATPEPSSLDETPHPEPRTTIDASPQTPSSNAVPAAHTEPPVPPGALLDVQRPRASRSRRAGRIALAALAALMLTAAAGAGGYALGSQLANDSGSTTPEAVRYGYEKLLRSYLRSLATTLQRQDFDIKRGFISEAAMSTVRSRQGGTYERGVADFELVSGECLHVNFVVDSPEDGAEIPTMPRQGDVSANCSQQERRATSKTLYVEPFG